jgi:peptidyl-prolyl cis-trans isomerase SurA
MKKIWALSAAAAFVLPLALFSQSKSVVVEEIVARVNNDVITLSDYQHADATLHDEVAHECQNCTRDKLDSQYKERQKDLLRDLIDQDLLVQRAKDAGISVETDLIKQLDQVRKDNNLPSMEALEEAVRGQGLSWEDYKNQMRNGLLTQEVIRKEVGQRIDIGSDEVKKYYEEHKQEFVRPEQVLLAEILLGTEGKSPEEIAAVQRKAEDYYNRLKKGEEFSELAKRYSEGATGKDGGGLGAFKRGELAPQLETAVFSLEKGQFTEPLQTKSGFEILKVLDHFQPGQQPLDKVEPEIMNRLYMQKMQPTLRGFLAELREESYVTVKPGYTDTAAVPGASVITEVQPSPDTEDKKKSKKHVPLPKPKSGGS